MLIPKEEQSSWIETTASCELGVNGAKKLIETGISINKMETD